VLRDRGIAAGDHGGCRIRRSPHRASEGDRLLLFSDGALEISNAAGEMLGLDGLIEMLKKQGYPAADLQMEILEEDL
jgi:serine phosphatase RsbU (regulator of sigma subunit)